MCFDSPKLCTADQVPACYVRPGIKGGFRLNFSLTDCLKSAFYPHNEWINFWTHFLGSIVVFCLFLADIPIMVELLGVLDFIMWSMASLGAISCLMMSAIYHLFCSHSEWSYHNLQCLDIVGIGVMICTNYISPLWFGFWCYPYARVLYNLVVMGMLSLCVVIPSCGGPPKAWRVILPLIVFFAPIPAAHWMSVSDEYEFSMAFSSLVGMLGSYFFGYIVYAMHIPERWLPLGTTDVIGHSHQIWHLCVLSAALFSVINVSRVTILKASNYECGI